MSTDLGIKRLNFILPDSIFASCTEQLHQLTKELEALGNKAGRGSKKFEMAYGEVLHAVRTKQSLLSVLNARIKLRALTVILGTPLGKEVVLTASVFNRIETLRPRASSLLIENLLQNYLRYYDQLPNFLVIAAWLKEKLNSSKKIKYPEYVFRENGPKWLAYQCIRNNRDFLNIVDYLGLKNYAEGRFLSVAQSIYFVEQLKTIPVNEPHELLLEVQKKSTFNARYDANYLLGHKVLQILIERAPSSEIHESWRNTIMAIAGDPRVPKTHPRYQKWWSRISPELIAKVRGWLSRFDLGLFLEALEDYAQQSGNDPLIRMFPAREVFLKGLLDKKLITNTRLYISKNADKYLRRNYDREHLPAYSIVKQSSTSIIHVQFGQAHMIEGSHSCKLWIYERLDPSAVVFDYNRSNVSYRELTQGLSKLMEWKGCPHKIDITHNPNIRWQYKAVQALREVGVDVSAKDILLDEDYSIYIRRY